MTNITFEAKNTNWARIKVVGVGGGGTNAVNYMINNDVKGVEFYVANTDLQSLAKSPAANKIQLGTNLTKGLGAGAKLSLGRDAAEEAVDKIEKIMENTDMFFITAGMGGGTGTGASSVFARIARDKGILTVAVVTKPFKFEGPIRAKYAEEGINQLKKHVDTLITIPNERLLQLPDKKITAGNAFDMADSVLLDAVRGISDLIVIPARINVDFADVQSIMSNMGDALMGTGNGEGEEGAIDAVKKAIHCPLIEKATVKGAKGILISYIVGPDIPLNAIDEANKIVVEEADKNVNVIFGMDIDENFGDKVKVTIIATGFGKENVSEEDVPFDGMISDVLLPPDIDSDLLNKIARGEKKPTPKRPAPKNIIPIIIDRKDKDATITKDEVYHNPGSISRDRINYDTPAFIRKKKRPQMYKN